MYRILPIIAIILLIALILFARTYSYWRSHEPTIKIQLERP